MHGQESRRLNGLDGDERLKISDQINSLQSIRDRNTKVATLGDVIKNFLPEIDPIHANGGADATLPQKQEAFTDVIFAALASGLTNVVTYTIDDLGTDISSLPENEEKTSIHAVGHGMGGRSDEMRDVIKTHHMRQVESLVTKLKSVREGNGTMFDNSTIIYQQAGSGDFVWFTSQTATPAIRLITCPVTSVDVLGAYNGVHLQTNYPNPTAGETRFTFTSDWGGDFMIELRDLQGRLVDVIDLGARPVGEHTVVYDATPLADGMYTFSLMTEGVRVTKKMRVQH